MLLEAELVAPPEAKRALAALRHLEELVGHFFAPNVLEGPKPNRKLWKAMESSFDLGILMNSLEMIRLSFSLFLNVFDV